MVSTFTANKNLEEPGRGDQVGTWDTPVNSNTTIIDNSFGGLATVALTNSDVVLSAAQHQCNQILLTGNISANIAITFPYVGSFYTVENRTTGAFNITLKTSSAGAEIVGLPYAQPMEVVTRPTTAGVRFRNLDPIGTFWDFAGSSVPAWVTNCTIPPYLLCDGSSIPAAYTYLSYIIGSNFLPDARGRTRFSLNSGTGRVTTAGGGIDGNTNFAAGGVETVTLSASNMAPHAHTVVGTVDSGISRALKQGAVAIGVLGSGAVSVFEQTQYNDVAVTNSTGVSNPMTNLPPAYIGGITMIRAG